MWLEWQIRPTTGEHLIKVSNYRYERKFLIAELSEAEVIDIVKRHPKIFSEIYYQRFVNNIYYDSCDLTNYHDNVSGAADRVKYRIRWYGDLFGDVLKPTFEIKIKRGLVGKKESYPVVPFALSKNAKISSILKFETGTTDPLILNTGHIEPILLNRYSRTYYQSFDKRFRITVDHDQSFYQVNKGNNKFMNYSCDKDTTILELKYEVADDFEVGEVTSIFPFRLSKSSKYVNGIERVIL